jgi:D-alanine-D-alanine ligase
MKKKVLIIFGGKSGEHEISVRSAKSVEQNIDHEQFETHCLGITQDGQWHYGQTIQEITDGQKVLPTQSPIYLPTESQHASFALQTTQGLEKFETDLIFPVLHGTNGEDGTIQGLLELLNLPYVGSGVLGSAVAMDKVIQKTICGYHQIPQTKFTSFTKSQWQTDPAWIKQRISQELTLPFFVKPANLGSSVGISKVKTSADLDAAILDAFRYDQKIIIEEGVNDILEIEVSVLGNEKPIASVCGSVEPKSEFYDYQTKYITGEAEMNFPARIPAKAADEIRQTALKTFSILNCSGLARVDFFYQPSSEKFFLNELNTLPGFTSLSVYPKLWEASGVSYTQLITKLLELAEERWQAKQSLEYTFS